MKTSMQYLFLEVAKTTSGKSVFASYSVENGSSPVSAVRDLRPPIHFLVQKQIQDQVRRWPSKRRYESS